MRLLRSLKRCGDRLCAAFARTTGARARRACLRPGKPDGRLRDRRVHLSRRLLAGVFSSPQRSKRIHCHAGILPAQSPLGYSATDALGDGYRLAIVGARRLARTAALQILVVARPKRPARQPAEPAHEHAVCGGLGRLAASHRQHRPWAICSKQSGRCRPVLGNIADAVRQIVAAHVLQRPYLRTRVCAWRSHPAVPC